MAAVRVTDQNTRSSVDLIINESKGLIVVSFPGATDPWLVKPRDLLVALIEASNSFNEELAETVRSVLKEGLSRYTPRE